MQRSHIAFLLSAAVLVQSCRSTEFSTGPETRTRVEGNNRGSGSNPADDKSKLMSQDEAKGMYAPAGGKGDSGLPNQSSDPNDRNSPSQIGKKQGVEQNDDGDKKDKDDNKKREVHSDKSKKSNDHDDDSKKKRSHHSGGSNPWPFIIAAAAGAVIIGAFVINSNGDCRANTEPQTPVQSGYTGMHLSPEQLVDDAIQGRVISTSGPFCDSWITKRVSANHLIKAGVDGGIVDPQRVNCGYVADVSTHAKQQCGR